MRYLTLSKSGNWYFRYQLPRQQRPLFENRSEIKRSLKTSCKHEAKLLALELELSIRKKVMGQLSRNELWSVSKPPAIEKKATKPDTCPFSILEKFYLYKLDHVSLKTADSLKAQCTTILSLINKSNLKSIRRAEAEAVKQALRLYPTNVRKHREFRGLTAREAININKRIGKPTLSNESVKDYIQKASSFFEWCLANEFTDINPFKGIKFRKANKDSEAKSAYSSTQLKTVFEHCIFTETQPLHPHYYWLPLLAKLTGARLNELCQLYADDIVRINDIWCISIAADKQDQKLKNAESKRLVPIHNRLINLGFLEFVKERNNGRLFSELRLGRDGYGSAPSKWYGRFKTQLGFERGHDFHSFRHTVATELKNALVDHKVASSLLGHSLNNITYDRYGKGYNIEILAQAINALDVSALNKVLPYHRLNIKG